jgi:hypothetical protein
VRERTREIGTLKALGASGWSVLGQFMLEGETVHKLDFLCFWRKWAEKNRSFLVFLGFLLVFGQSGGC